MHLNILFQLILIDTIRFKEQKEFEFESITQMQGNDHLQHQKLVATENPHGGPASSRTNEVSNSNMDQDDGFEMEPSQMTAHSDPNTTPPSIRGASARQHDSNQQPPNLQHDLQYGQLDAHAQQVIHFEGRGHEDFPKPQAFVHHTGLQTNQPGVRVQQQNMPTYEQQSRPEANEVQSDAQCQKASDVNMGEDAGAGAGATMGGPGGQSTFSNLMSNIGSARALSMPISAPLSAGRGSSAQGTKTMQGQSHNTQERELNLRDTQLQSSEVAVNDFRDIDVPRQMSEHPHARRPSTSQMEAHPEADRLMGRSANASMIPLQYQGQQQRSIQPEQQSERVRSASQASGGTNSSMVYQPAGPSGPSPLVRQLSEKIRLQAERLQIMEAYKALCERRILDYDPDHPMPVMPHHLGTVFTPEAGILGDEQAQNQSAADLKRLLALKEQDLLYAKQRNEKLLREIDDMTSNNGKPTGNFEALRKEIELNEKLQKQIEMYQQKLAEVSQNGADGSAGRHQASHSRRNSEKKLDASSRSSKSEAAQNLQPQLKALREQVESLTEEKNALLDYIDEHVDKNVALTDRTSASQQVDRLSQEVGEANARNAELTKKLQEARAQNEHLLRNQYSSPNFAQLQGNSGSETAPADKQPRQDQQQQPPGELRPEDLAVATSQAKETDPEGTFGAKPRTQAQSRVNNSIDGSQNPEQERAEELATLQQQMNAMKQEYESMRQENQNMQAQLARAESAAAGQATSAANQGNLSHRSGTQRSVDRASEGGLSTSGNSGQKQKIRDLEMRLKASQENIRTLSQTLNETQSELENLVRDHEQANRDLKQQLQENANMQGLLDSDQRLIEQLKNEKSVLQAELSQALANAKKLEHEALVLQKQGEADQERNEKLEGHIRALKEDQQRRVENVASRWEETVAELTRELESAKSQVKQRQDMFYKMEEELRKKVEGAEGETREKSKLEQRVEDLSHEVRTLQSQKNEKDQKLKSQLKKNEELLGELQELSEAVNALKNDRELTLKSEVLEEKDHVISEFENFFDNKQRRALEKIFSQLLRFAELMREFSKTHKLEELSKGTHAGTDGRSGDQQEEVLSAKTLFLQIDRSLKNVADMQIMLQQNKKGFARHADSAEHLNQRREDDGGNQNLGERSEVPALKALKVEKDLKIMTELLKDLEALTGSLVQWNQNLMAGYGRRTQELNQTQKQLLCETDANCTLKEQVERMELEGAHAVEKDQHVEFQLRKIGDQLQDREKQMEDAYRREERLAKQNQKLRTQLDGAGKDQQKIMKQILQLIQEKEVLVSENEQMAVEMRSQSEHLRVVEYQMSAMQQQVDQVNLMIDNLRASMPSEELGELVGAMKSQIAERFTLNEQYTLKETELLAMENELKQLAKSDHGLSQKVIQLRKDIDQYRKDLKALQILKKKFDKQNEEILDNLKNCELVERRRHDVALETEKALVEARNQVRDMKKEVAFANASKKDLELAVFGLQEQNGMLERELTALRQQLAAGAYYANRTATLGGVLSKMGGGFGGPPSLGGSARTDTGRRSNQESVDQNYQNYVLDSGLKNNTKTQGLLAHAGSSTHPNTQREGIDIRIHQSSSEAPMGPSLARPSVRTLLEPPIQTIPPDQEPNLNSGLRVGGSSSDLRTQSSAMMHIESVNNDLERMNRQVGTGQIQIHDGEAHRIAMGNQVPAPVAFKQRSMSLGASASSGPNLAGPRALDVSKEPDELLAGEISRIHAVMSGSGSDINRLNVAYAQALPSSNSQYKGSFNLNNATQTSLSGPTESLAKTQINDQVPHVSQQRPRLPPMYPQRFQTIREKREEMPARQEAVEGQVLVHRDHYVSDFGNRTYGGQVQEYGTFGGLQQLKEQFENDGRSAGTQSGDLARTAAQQKQSQDNLINPYPSMQNIHTVSLGPQQQHDQVTPVVDGRNLFTQPSLTRTPIFLAPQNFDDEHSLQRASSTNDKGSLVVGEQPGSGRGSDFKQQSPLMPRTASVATHNTEQSSGQHLFVDGAHQTSAAPLLGPARHETKNDEPQPGDKNSLEDGNGGPDDLPDVIEDDLDNSLLKSELLEKNDEGQTSVDDVPAQGGNLQDKLSQVKNVFTAIRQNLHEGSTDPREASSDRAML